MTAKLYPLLAACLIFAGCGKPKGDITAEKAVEITNASWTEHVPQMKLERFATRVEDLGDRWRVTYRIAEGSTGGPWIFIVSKKSGEIVSSEGGQ
jgi:myosin-crossreactive antigen